MSHQLKMAKVQAILQLHSLGWSGRQIAEHLGIHRETVGRYLRLRNVRPKPAIWYSGKLRDKTALHMPKPRVWPDCRSATGLFIRCLTP